MLERPTASHFFDVDKSLMIPTYNSESQHLEFNIEQESLKQKVHSCKIIKTFSSAEEAKHVISHKLESLSLKKDEDSLQSQLDKFIVEFNAEKDDRMKEFQLSFSNGQKMSTTRFKNKLMFSRRTQRMEACLC